jgi:hypothetical protein
MLLPRHSLGTIALLGAAAAAAGCGGNDETPAGGQGGSAPTTTVTTDATTGVGGAGGGADGAGGGGGAGGGPACPPTEGVTLALTKLMWGEGLNGEWKKVGANIDGLVSDGTSTDVCQPAAGGSAGTAFPDGDDGIDNSFGKNLLPVIVGLIPQWPSQVNNSLETGFFNGMLKLYCLPPEGDATDLMTKVFVGTTLGSTPKYDGTDVWPVAPEMLGDPSDPESSTLVFLNSSVTGAKYDSGKDQSFVLSVPTDYNDKYTTLKLTLYAAQVTMTLSEDRKSATGGVLSGVLNTEEFVDQVKKVGWMGDLCEQPFWEDMLTEVRRMSDIMTDGTQDPTKECDGISFGVQFEMKEVKLGDVGPPSNPGQACP